MAFLTIVELIMLLREVNVSTLLCENGHGSQACLRKWHRQVHVLQLIVRAFLHRCRVLFNWTKVEIRMRSLQKRVARLTRKRPNCFTGRQLYLRDLIWSAVESGAADEKTGVEIAQDCFRDHGKLYKELPRALQRSTWDPHTCLLEGSKHVRWMLSLFCFEVILFFRKVKPHVRG